MLNQSETFTIINLSSVTSPLSMTGNNITSSALSHEIIATYYPALVTDYFQLAVAVLILYDYLLTLPLEISLVWSRKMNIMNILFLVNRYFGTLEQYGSVFLFFLRPASNAECSAFYYIGEIPSVLQDIAFCGVFTLRTYAIYGKSWTVFVVLAIPALASVVSALLGIFSQTASAYPRQLQGGPKQCSFDTSFSLFTSVLFNSVANAVFDILVLTLTVYRTARLVKESRGNNLRTSLSYIVLRDGIAFYAVIFLPILVSCALNAFVLKTDSTKVSFISESFTYVIQVVRIIAINRLVLNLNYTANIRDDWEYHSQTGLDPPTFASNSVLGNIGGLVRSAPDDFDEESIDVREHITDNDELHPEFQEKLAGTSISGPSPEIVEISA